MTETSIDGDQFRKMEKRIKNYVRRVSLNKSIMSKRQKSRAEQQNSCSEEARFSWLEVVDVHKTKTSFHCVKMGTDLHDTVNGGSSEMAMSGIAKCKVFDLGEICPGLYIVSNALSEKEQLHWATKAVEEYSLAEHNNLNNLNSLYGGRHASSVEQKSHEGTTSDTNTTNGEINNSISLSTPHGDIPSVEELWKISSQEEVPFQTFAKLRWSCLGYHYDWTKRMYQKNLKSEFPVDLATLCSTIARCVSQDITVEAAIVNYYPVGTTMGGHLDDAEHTMEKPIVSISLGLSALFLIGGRSRSVTPSAVLVRSGDAVIMSGESRYCYHGVPVILPIDFEPLPDDMEKGADVGKKVNDLQYMVDYASREGCPDCVRSVVQYLQQARINMNVRQVTVSGGADQEWVEKCGTGATKS